MIKKFLVEDEFEEVFKKLSASKQLQYYKICNHIEQEVGEFIVVADISEDICSVSKMQYIQKIMTWISSETF